MKNKKISARIAAAALCVAGVSLGTPAFAAPIMIDFTNDTWLGAQGQSAYTRSYGAVDVTISTSGWLTFNASEAPDADLPDLALVGDGIGVRDDEISWGERLDVLFSTSVTVLGYYFLDFFAGEGPDGGGELATVVLDTVSLLDEGLATDDVGYYARDLSALTTSISFFAGPSAGGDAIDGYWFSDFALAGILIDDGTEPVAATVPVAVPEPETLALFAVGLLGLAAAGRREPLRAAQRVRRRSS